MSVLKGEIKVAAIHEVGCKLDDSLEAVRREMVRAEGAVVALQKAVPKIQALSVHVDKDVDEGRLDLELAKLVKQYIARAAIIVDSESKEAENARQRGMGAVAGMERAVQLTKGLMDQERAKVEAVKAAEDAPEETRGRPVGVRPEPIKAQRLAEDAAPKKRGRKPKEKTSNGAHAG